MNLHRTVPIHRLVRRFRQRSGKLYDDPTDHATIGFGHLIHYGPVTEADHREWFLRGSPHRSQIHGNRRDLRRSPAAVKEGVEGLGILAFRTPDDPASGPWSTTNVKYLWCLRQEISLMPTPNRPSRRWSSSCGRHHPFAGPSHGPPRHPAQPGDRGSCPSAVASQASRSSRSRVRLAPGRAKGTASTTTPWSGQRRRRRVARTSVARYPGRGGARERRRRAGVKGEAGLEPALRADQASPAQGHGDDHDGGEELHGDDIDVVEPQEALECGGGGVRVAGPPGSEARSP